MRRTAGLLLIATIIVIALVRARHTQSSRIDDGVLRVVVLGDSVAHGAGDETGRGIEGCLDRKLLARARAFVPAVNYGINGGRTLDALRLLRSRAAQPALQAASAVIVSIGGNDLYGDPLARLRSTVWPAYSMHRAMARVNNVVHRIHALNPTARIFILGLYNPYRRSGIGSFLDRQVNAWDSLLIGRFAADPSVSVIRIADLFQFADRLSPLDHFHPSADGYALIAERIAVSF
ncbi:MAG: GDSL-type esterase/lipase family protein [Thermoanaerobaculia bacterium]